MRKKPSALSEFTPEVMVTIDRILAEHGYERKERIGHGGYSIIFKVFCPKYQMHFAAKIVHLTSTRHINCDVAARNETSALRCLNHPNIIKLYDEFEHDGFAFMILQLCTGKTLYQLIKGNLLTAVPDRCRVMRDMARALVHMHSHGIAHCDIKPQNVLFDENGNARLADFGMAKFFAPGELSSDFSGTPQYMSPEIFRRKPFNPYPADVWALGVTFYQVVGGVVEKSQDIAVLAESVLTGGFLIQGELNPPIGNLIACMTAQNPRVRPTVDLILKQPLFNRVPNGLPPSSSKHSIVTESDDGRTQRWKKVLNPNRILMRPKLRANSVANLLKH